MRRVIAVVCVAIAATVSLPLGAMAAAGKPAREARAAQQSGNVAGTAQNAASQPLAGHRVRIRRSGQKAVETVSDAAGNFNFSNLTPGRWTIEIIGPRGELIGISPVTVAAGTTATVTVTAAAAGALAAAGGAAATLPLIPLSVAAAAVLAGVTAFVVTRPDASASR